MTSHLVRNLRFLMAGNTWRVLALVLGPVAVVPAAFGIMFMAMAILLFRGTGVGGLGHAPSSKACAWSALAVTVVAAVWTGLRAARIASRYTLANIVRPGWPAGISESSVRRTRAIAVAVLLVFVPTLWHEHRFWRAYEIAASSSASRGDIERWHAIDCLGKLGDQRALPLLLRLASTRADAMMALVSMGSKGKIALIEYARGDADPGRRAGALLSLCGLYRYGRGLPYDPAVRELVAAAMNGKDEQVRASAERCAAAMQRVHAGR